MDDLPERLARFANSSFPREPVYGELVPGAQPSRPVDTHAAASARIDAQAQTALRAAPVR